MLHTNQYRLDLKAVREDMIAKSFILDDAYFSDPEMAELSGGRVQAQITVRKHTEFFDVDFTLTGEVQTTCDRCLDLVNLPVSTTAHLTVRFDKRENSDDDRTLVVAEKDGSLDAYWLMYEFLVLSLPMQRIHKEGGCNPEIIEIYEAHCCRKPEGRQIEKPVSEPLRAKLKELTD